MGAHQLLFSIFCFQISFCSVKAQGVELYLFKENNEAATQHRIDSLKLQLKSNAPDSQKVVWLLELAAVERIEADSASLYGNAALRLIKKHNYKWGLAEYYNYKAGYYGTFGTMDLDSALFYYEAAHTVVKESNLLKDSHKYISSILNLYFYSGAFTSAMKLCTKGLQLAESERDSAKIASYHNIMGFIYLRQGNIEDSRKSYQRYHTLSQQFGDTYKVSDALVGLADVYLAEKKPDLAIPLLLKALDYFENHFRQNRYSGKTEKIPYTCFTLANAYRLKSDNRTALSYCLKGFDYSKYFPFNQYDLAQYYIITANVYDALGRYGAAIAVMNKGLSLSMKIKHAENLRDAYGSLAEIFAREKLYDSAYHYHILFATLKDSIINQRSRREIREIEATYDLERKDQEIAIHRAETDKQKFIRNSIAGSAIALILISYLVYNRYQLRQRNRFQQVLGQKQSELFHAVSMIQDQERKRIAQDIHDQVGSVLSAAKLQLSGLEELKERLDDSQKQKYASAMDLMDQAAEELRNISHNLMPAALSRLGLVSALKSLFDQISRHTSLRIVFNAHGFDTRIDEPTEINIYPVVLELINNTVKHANASEVIVQLVRFPEYINITVEDNGQGFDVREAKTKDRGIGMRSLDSRVQFLNGSLNIDSVVGKGTTIMIDIPLGKDTN